MARGALGASLRGGHANRVPDEEVRTVKAHIGDQIVVRSAHVDEHVRACEVLEVRGRDGDRDLPPGFEHFR